MSRTLLTIYEDAPRCPHKSKKVGHAADIFSFKATSVKISISSTL